MEWRIGFCCVFVHASVGADGIEADALLRGPNACNVIWQ